MSSSSASAWASTQVSRPSPRRAIWGSTSIEPHASVPRRTGARCSSPSQRGSRFRTRISRVSTSETWESTTSRISRLSTSSSSSLPTFHRSSRRCVAQEPARSSRVPSRAARTSLGRRQPDGCVRRSRVSARHGDRRLISRSSAGRSGRFCPRRHPMTRGRWRSLQVLSSRVGARWSRPIATWQASIVTRWSDGSTNTGRWESSRDAQEEKRKLSLAGSHTSTASRRGGTVSRRPRANWRQRSARSARASVTGR